jgi:uncharacterized membrane protein
MEHNVWVLFHPAVIHFPIALLLLNGVLTCIYLRRADAFVERAAYGALVLGWWGALAAIGTGLLAVAVSWPLQDVHVGWINAHAVLGTLALLVYGRALLQRRRDPRILESSQRRNYLALLVLGVLLVVGSGWTGGHLVYALGFGVR